MSALHASMTIGTTSANSENTDPRAEARRLRARAMREPSFLVSHPSIGRQKSWMNTATRVPAVIASA